MILANCRWDFHTWLAAHIHKVLWMNFYLKKQFMFGTLPSTSLQDGPLPLISRVITPLIGAITYNNPSYPFIRPFLRVVSPLITGKRQSLSWFRPKLHALATTTSRAARTPSFCQRWHVLCCLVESDVMFRSIDEVTNNDAYQYTCMCNSIHYISLVIVCH